MANLPWLDWHPLELEAVTKDCQLEWSESALWSSGSRTFWANNVNNFVKERIVE